MTPFDDRSRLWQLDGQSSGLLMAAQVVGELAKTANAEAVGMCLSIIAELKAQHAKVHQKMLEVT